MNITTFPFLGTGSFERNTGDYGIDRANTEYEKGRREGQDSDRDLFRINNSISG
jgi:hypothetical protein